MVVKKTTFNCRNVQLENGHTPDDFKERSRSFSLDTRVTELTQLLVVWFRVVAEGH